MQANAGPKNNGVVTEIKTARATTRRQGSDEGLAQRNPLSVEFVDA